MMMVSLIMILFWVLIIYFAIFRPQRSKQKKRATMLNSIEEGTIIYTEDGIRGKVEHIKGNQLSISCYPDQARLFFNMESCDRIEGYDEKAANAKMKEKIQRSRKRQKNN